MVSCIEPRKMLTWICFSPPISWERSFWVVTTPFSLMNFALLSLNHWWFRPNCRDTYLDAAFGPLLLHLRLDPSCLDSSFWIMGQLLRRANNRAFISACFNFLNYLASNGCICNVSTVPSHQKVHAMDSCDSYMFAWTRCFLMRAVKRWGIRLAFDTTGI